MSNNMEDFYTRDNEAQREKEFVQTCRLYGIKLSRNAYRIAQHWQIMGADWSLIMDYAIEQTAVAPVPSFAYLAAIVKRCLSEGITSAAAAEQRDAQRRAARKRAYFSASDAYYSDPDPEPGEMPTGRVTEAQQADTVRFMCEVFRKEGREDEARRLEEKYLATV